MWLRQRESRSAAAALAARRDADDRLAGGVGVQRGGESGGGIGGGLQRQPSEDAAADSLQPPGGAVPDTGSIDRELGPLQGAGGVDPRDRRIQRTGTSL